MNFREFVECRIAERPDDRLLESVIRSVDLFIGHEALSSLDSGSLKQWLSGMMLDNLKGATIRKYAGRLHSLFREWRRGGSSDPFDDVKEWLKIDAEAMSRSARGNLTRLRSLMRSPVDAVKSADFRLFLFLIYGGAPGIDQASALTLDSRHSDLPQLQELIDLYRSEGRKKYLIPLGQGKSRPGRIRVDALAGIRSTLRGYGFEIPDDFSEQTLWSMRIAAALRTGASAGEVRGMWSLLPREYSFLEIAEPEEVTPGRLLEINRRIADYINNRKVCWYIMRIRGSNSPETIREAIAARTPKLHEGMEFYYPRHEVVRFDSRRRKVRRKVAYMPHLLFFKMRSDKVGRLFAKIGDLAWCYRQTNSPASPYCEITPGEMRRFQYHVGQFTSDVEVRIIGRDEPLAEGKEVRIIGGGRMEGFIGRISSVRNGDGTRTYSLRLKEDEAAVWTVKDVDERFLEEL